LAVKFPSGIAAQVAATEVTRTRFLPRGLRVDQYRNRVHRSGWTVWTVGKDENLTELLSKVKASPHVITAQPLNRIYPLLDEPDDGDFNVIETSQEMIPLGEDASYRRLWYLDDTSAFDAWSDWPNQWFTQANKPRNVPLIAVIDTGVDRHHPDFINAGGSSSDAADGGQFELDMDAQFQFGEVVPDGIAEDTMGHGTHVTGLALAAGNNGSFEDRGIVGMGYPSRGMTLRVFDDNGTGSDADAAGAIFYAADAGADIINMSLGTENFSQLFQDAITYAWQKGVLVVCASNEDGSGGGDLGPIYPAASSGAFAVTANGYGYVHASDYYAGTGSYIDLAAPGGNLILDYADIENPLAMLVYIYSTTMRTWNPIMEALGGGPPPGYGLDYGYLIGTSMACPIVAGTASLYYGKHDLRASQGWANQRTYRALQRSAWGVYGAPNGSWETHQGYGSLDAYLLLQDADTRNAKAGAIEGIVYYEGTALGNATVRARRDGGTVTYQTTTATDGRYRYDQLPAGNYTVWATGFGQQRTTRAVVVPGSDAPAVNFWTGTFTGDDTPPIIRTFAFLGHGAAGGSGAITTSRFKAWAMDTETGIEEYAIKLGTTVGAGDILPKTVLTLDTGEFELSHPDISSAKAVYATLEVRNGNRVVTSQSIPLGAGQEWACELVGHSVPTTVSAGQTFFASFTLRNTGTQVWSSNSLVRISLTALSGTLGPSRASLPPGKAILPGETVTVRVPITAPSTPGLRWVGRQMMRGTNTLGSPTPMLSVIVE
jgi:serine protease